MDQNKLNELKELARKATPGPYKCEDMIALSFSCSEVEKYYNVYTYENEQIAEFDDAINKEANAKYFAAVNPQVVLALIEKIEILEKEADWLAEQASLMCDCIENCDEFRLFLDCQGKGCKEVWRDSACKAVEENSK